MDLCLKRKLEKRNARIINAVIRKVEAVCPGAVALIGIEGSFNTGDMYEKSDLDLCIIINDDCAWDIATCFILEDVGFDIYCTPWSRLESISEYNNPHITRLLNLDIVYSSDHKHLERFMNLRSNLIDKLNEPYSSENTNKAEKFVDEASKSYANMILGDEYGECRYAAADMLCNVEYAVYMYNKTYIKRGIKRIPQDLSSMEHVPVDFDELYWKVIRASDVEELKRYSTLLLKSLKSFACEMKEKVATKEDISEDNIRGTYEEIHSNWKNKIHNAANRNDSYSFLMAAASCQKFYDIMYAKYNIDRIDLMKDMTPADLDLSAEAFDQAMEEYKKNYDKLNAEIKLYKDLDEFEKDYLA